MMHVIAAQKNSALNVRNFIFPFRYCELINSRVCWIFQDYMDTSHPQMFFSMFFSMTAYFIYSERTNKSMKKNVPMTLKRLQKSNHNEDKLLFHYNFLALMIHSYTCDNAQITGWRIILSWLMRLNFQKNWISSSLYHHIKMLWQYIYVSMTYRNV